MKTFMVINENLVFKSATKLFEFLVPKDKKHYILYYVTDLEDNNSDLMVSYLEKDEDKDCYYLKDLDDLEFKKISGYIEFLLLGTSSKKEIKIVKDSYCFEENMCQTVIEKNRHIKCDNILDLDYAISNMDNSCFDSFIYVNDLNDILYKIISSRNDSDAMEIRKENIKGNINIFFLTLFSVVFLTVLIFMAFGLFYH